MFLMESVITPPFLFPAVTSSRLRGVLGLSSVCDLSHIASFSSSCVCQLSAVFHQEGSQSILPECCIHLEILIVQSCFYCSHPGLHMCTDTLVVHQDRQAPGHIPGAWIGSTQRKWREE